MSRDGTGAPSIRQNKAKKRGRRLMIAYALRGVIFLLLALIMVGSFSFRALYFQLLVYFNIYKIGILIHSNTVKYYFRA